MSLRPNSHKAKEALWGAYEGLNEKQKRAITRHISKKNPGMFDYWLRSADLVRGYDKRKVIKREGTYGGCLDKALRELRDGAFAANLFAEFLQSQFDLEDILSCQPEDADAEAFAGLVDETAAESDSGYASFAAAFVKCYRPLPQKKTMIVETPHDEMGKLVKKLDEHAEKMENWANSLRIAETLPQDEIISTIISANENVEQLTALMKKHRKATGVPERAFKMPSDVAAHMNDLCEALSDCAERDKIISFLGSLAKALRGLEVTHRSATEQTRLSAIREQAAVEVEKAVDSEAPNWTCEMKENGIAWLRWSFEIEADELTIVQDQLKEDGYENLSEFVGIGEVGWIKDAPEFKRSQGEQKALFKEKLEIRGPIPHNAATDSDEENTDTAGPLAEDKNDDPYEEAVESPFEMETSPATGNICESPTDRTKENTILDAEAAPQAGKNEIPPGAEVDEMPVIAEETTSTETDADQDEAHDLEPPDEQSTAKIDWEEKDIQTLSKAVSGSRGKIFPSGAINALAGKLSLDEEFALAYHLVNAAQAMGMRGGIPAWIYGSVAIGTAIKKTDQSAITLLQGFYQQYDNSFFDEFEAPDRMAVRLLITAGGLEPSLFFPITGAAGILKTLRLHRVKGLQSLVSCVAEYGSRGVGLPRAALFSSINADVLKQKQDAVQIKAKEWLQERAPKFDIVSRPGQETWRAWIGKDGPVGRLLNPVIAGRLKGIQEIKELAERYSNSAMVDQDARRLFRNELQHRGELLRPALNNMRRHTTEAIDIANEWINAVESQSKNPQRFDQKMLAQLRNCFSEHTQQAQEELEELKDEANPAAVRAGAFACARVVEDIVKILDGETGDVDTVDTRNAHRLLNDPLLRVDDLSLDESGSPRLFDYLTPPVNEEALQLLSQEVLKAISEKAITGFPSMAEAARKRGEKGDHEATRQIFNLLEGHETPDGLKRLEHERQQSIARHRQAAKQELKKGQRALSDALTKGLYAAQEYERWAVQIETADQDMRKATFRRFSDVYALCRRLKDELAKRQSREIARLRKEIAQINPSEEHRGRLDDVLAAGDVLTVTDYIDRIRNQIELPDVQESDNLSFIQFFSDGEESAFNQIERELKATNSPNSLSTRIANKKPVKGLQLERMQTTQARESADFVKLWFKLKRERALNEKDGLSIFSFFGMRPKKMVQASGARNGGQWGDVWNLEVESLESRDECPYAMFGSNANGQYKLMCYWQRPAAEDILQHARGLGTGAFIVLFFGRMGDAERRSLLAEPGRGNVIVLDDILAVFLAGQRKGRLHKLFLCTLPFAHISPYTKAASLLPPEMFYGRHREIDQLMSAGTDSSCLLYGGRQIGKTVLLHHVQRLFERSAPKKVAIYIDLKGKEIGTNRPMDEIWLVIAEEMAKREVIKEKVGRQTKHDWLFARIEEWLAGDNDRSILVLLDESDAFLSADAKGQDTKVEFSACTVLKDLMERTNRRFKIVFAGLHNVQKSTKVSNNPLAHFGQPICIGAMTEAGESRQAEALITEPLATAGYFFESPDLPARILAQTNYYPNLIQIYCDTLLKFMQQRSQSLFPSGKTPPYFINPKILEDVYEQHELREELRLRFKWTLELDRRFELIANILALYDVDCTRGQDIAELRQNAQDYWKNGFRTKDGMTLTHEGFKGLLEEMVGLGILRRAEPPDHYALRNPNVMNLIGSRADVERLLEDAHKWEPIDVYDPTKFRGQISAQNKALRSPLNAAQEFKFKSGTNQVFVVCGCSAGRVDQVEKAISYRFGKDGYVRVLKGHEELSEFRNELSQLGNRKSGGTTLIVAPDSVRWDRNWIMEARKRVSRFKKALGAVGVVFIAGPEHLFSIVPDITRQKFDGVGFVSVEPWDASTVNQWLQESGQKAIDADCRTKIAEVTGNWPVLLEEAVKLVKGSADDAEGLGEKVIVEIFRAERKRELYDLFGLIETAVAPLQFLCEHGSGWSIEEICELLGDGEAGPSIEHVTMVLKWAELLSLAQHGPDGWALDPGVKQVLSIG